MHSKLASLLLMLQLLPFFQTRPSQVPGGTTDMTLSSCCCCGCKYHLSDTHGMYVDVPNVI